jgi:hypothetical protein
MRSLRPPLTIWKVCIRKEGRNEDFDKAHHLALQPSRLRGGDALYSAGREVRQLLNMDL